MSLDFEAYDKAFFDQQSERSLQSARVVLARAFEWLRPARVLDVGCGTGAWLRAARELGARQVIGLDGDYVDRRQLLIDESAFIPTDLESIPLQQALASAADEPFDLVICVEVAEHLPLARGPGFIAELAALGDALLFSAAVPFQYGVQHVNEQWPEFWSILLRGHGLVCYDCLRGALWADSDVEWWYRQNAFLYARDSVAEATGLPSMTRADGRGLSLIHPENLLANLLGLPRRYRGDAYAEELTDLRALTAANMRRDAALPHLAGPARAQGAPAGSRNVFPWTRNEIRQPEQEIDELVRELAEGRCRQDSTERALAATNEALACETAVCAEAKSRAESMQARAQAFAAAKLYSEQQVVDLKSAQSALQERLTATEQLLARMEASRDAMQASAEHFKAETAALRASIASTPAGAVSAHPVSLRHVGRWVRQKSKGGLRRLRRLTRSASKSGPTALPEAAPDGNGAREGDPPAGEALPLMHPIKRYDETFGEVSWWSLAAALERLRRFELFDPEDYLRRNPEVAAAGIDPGTHFIQSGALEGRGRFDPEQLARLMSGYMLFQHAVRALPPPEENLADLPELVADVGEIGIYVSSHGNTFMEEIADDLATDLRSVGAPVEVLDENAPMDGRPGVCLYIAPHEFFQLGQGRRWVRDDVFFEGFMFGTEQVQSTWFQQALPFMLMSRAMLDLCSQTVDLFRRIDMASLHVLPGTRLRPHTLTAADRRHGLFRVLPPAAHADPDTRRGFAERPIDVSFFGAWSPRRDQFFASNAAFFSDYEVFNYCRRPGRGPIRADGPDNPLTRLAGHVAGHSKITLNIHREEFGYFEWHRMVRLGMCAGSVVVSDPCLPDPSFVPGEHYFHESLRRIPDLLEWLLRTPDGEREAERVRANVDGLITNAFDTRRTAARTLRFLAQHRHRPNAPAGA